MARNVYKLETEDGDLILLDRRAGKWRLQLRYEVAREEVNSEVRLTDTEAEQLAWMLTSEDA